MESDYPYVVINHENISFSDGKSIKLPKEYLKRKYQKELELFYKNIDKSSEETIIGKDPVGFNYVICKDICIVGLLLGTSKESKSKINILKKKYPNNKFEQKFIISKIEDERKLVNHEEYLPIKLVTESVHELRNLNSKISSHIDTMLDIQDDTHWDTTFDNADNNVKKIYVASRLIKFILDNVKFYLPNSIETLNINFERDFVIHRSVSKIVKIYKNDFKKKKTEISLEGNSFKKMHGDKEIFEIALMLLIENALKYSNDPSTIAPKVIIEETDSKILIKIKSFGRIIPDQDRSSLFTRGFRSPAHAVKEGSGMGLHNAFRILQRFNSSLEYSSDVDKDIGWNTFTIICNDVL